MSAIVHTQYESLCNDVLDDFPDSGRKYRLMVSSCTSVCLPE